LLKHLFFLETSRVAFTLSWCDATVVDLDLYLFRPGADGKIQVSKETAIYWANNRTNEIDYKIELELDDEGVPSGPSLVSPPSFSTLIADC